MWNNLKLEDAKTLTSMLNAFPTGLSDHSFVNLWIWNSLRKYRWALLDESLCIRGEEKGNPFYLMPVGKHFSSSLFKPLFHEMPSFTMRAISESALSNILPLLPTECKSHEEEGRADYLYDFEQLIELKGNQYQAKRNLIHQFENLYESDYHPITEDNLPAMIELQKRWYAQHPQNERIDAEHLGLLSALHHFKKLPLLGGSLFVDGKPIAYTLGELIGSDTLLIHAEKALKDYKGAYQTINQAFLKHVPKRKYVNREEDLGLESLAHAKHSYHPLKMVNKFSLRRLS
jgi:uncharacterized protein